MPYNAPIQLDQIAEAQAGKAGTADAILAGMAAAALYGIRGSGTGGLVVVLMGGNISLAGVPTFVADQTVTLTASTTNYVYADSSGTVHNTTTIPSGWPGPLAAGATALYSFVTGPSTITSGTCYLVGPGSAGAAGPAGTQGLPGSDLAGTRKRWAEAIGSGSITVSLEGFAGFTLAATAVARTIASTSWRESIPYIGYESGTTAGSSAQVHHPQTYCFLGNAASRGGFNLAIRFCFENGFIAQPATARSFFGLFVPGTISNADPNTLTNMIGFGSNASDANMSFMHNGPSGTATMVNLGSNFPAIGTNNVYEMLLQSVANSGVVSYTFTDTATGNQATGSASSNLPANTTFLSWVMWVNNGTTAAKCSFGFMQTVGETRY